MTDQIRKNKYQIKLSQNKKEGEKMFLLNKVVDASSYDRIVENPRVVVDPYRMSSGSQKWN